MTSAHFIPLTGSAYPLGDPASDRRFFPLPPLPDLGTLLRQAESFIAGFEDDEAQQPAVAPLLATLRASIPIADSAAIVPPDAEGEAIHGNVEEITLYTLRFTSWECGHHHERPDDIPVSSPEQATLILRAISHAISQPGSAHAVLLDDEHAQTAYITDDYVSVGAGSNNGFDPAWRSATLRPVIVHGTAEEIEAIHSAELADAVEAIHGGPLNRWPADGKGWIDGDMTTTTLTPSEVEAIAAPAEPFEEPRPLVIDVPPVLRAAAVVLAELRTEAADIAAHEAEIAADKAQGAAA